MSKNTLKIERGSDKDSVLAMLHLIKQSKSLDMQKITKIGEHQGKPIYVPFEV